MSKIQSLFPTLLYRAEIGNAAKLNDDLEDAAITLSEDDKAGQRWCEKHGYPGYTSFSKNCIGTFAAASQFAIPFG
jgi:uncharacterized protein (TIGR02466 family)